MFFSSSKIFQNKSLMLNKYPEIEKCTESLMMNMNNLNRINLDEDLIDIITQIIRTLKYLPNLMINI